ncbi:MAG: HDIG domain-containing protein [Desulfobacteraceae bacterium]|nr:MAG: HDIG domain-containing protein [Desulfobacteraceae bacterium]
MKYFLSIVLVCAVSLACFGEEIYLSMWPPEPGQTIYLTHRSRRPFGFDQEKAFGSKREVAVSQYTPLYSSVQEGIESSKKKMRELIQKAAALQSQPQHDVLEFEKYLRKQFGIDVGAESAGALLKYPNLANLLQAVLAIEESLLASRIVEDPKPLKGKKTIEILFPKPLGTVAFPAAEVVTLEQARETLQSKISQVFWQVEKNILEPVVRIALANMTPNLKYDRVENDRRIEEILRRYPSKTIHYNAGDVLVPFRKVLNEEDVLLLSAHQELAEKGGLDGNLFWTLFAIFFSVAAYLLLLDRALPTLKGSRTPFLLYLSVLVLAIAVLDLFLLLTSIPIQALPVAFVPLLLSLLYHEKTAITLSTLVGVLLVSFFAGRSLQTTLFFGFGSIMAVLVTPVIRKRSQLVLPSFLVGCTNAVAVFFLLFDSMNHQGWVHVASTAGIIQPPMLEEMSLIVQMGWAFAGGVASAPLALLFLPFMERVWNTASNFKLFKYTDLDHPLLKDLLTKTPGTYQHTMTVAHLAQSASESIGADSLLVRVGAYYHDVGKTSDPEYFVENQFGGPNLHQDLSPQKSAEIITDHVDNGLKLAREAGLPEVIQAFITQHHGTQLLEFFHDKACNCSGNEKVLEGRFRYRGPKPRRVETAVLMIADAAEAASRTLHEKTRENIESMVRHIIECRIADGQFDECNFSTQDIAKVREALIDSLAASFHTRVEYPWQKNGAKNETEPASPKPFPSIISERSIRTM